MRTSAVLVACAAVVASTVGAGSVVAAGRSATHDGSSSARSSTSALSRSAEGAFAALGTVSVLSRSDASPVQVTLHPGDTAASALAAARVVVRDGRLLSARSARPLRPNGARTRVLVNGVLAGLTAALAVGDTVTVEPAADTREATERVTVPVFPPIPSPLYVGGSRGEAVTVLGVISHEQVSRQVIVDPTQGHLMVPGALALTFDDGPDPTWTPRVLAVLARHHVHAVFCVVGVHVAAHPDLLRAIVAGGHTVCDHTWTHDEALPSRTGERITEEMQRTSDAILHETGVETAFFRAPGGNWSPAVEAEATAQGMTPLRWTVDPRDWTRPGAPAIVAAVISRTRPGGVVLLHDGGGDRSQTLAALEALLTRLPALGFTFVTPPG